MFFHLFKKPLTLTKEEAPISSMQLPLLPLRSRNPVGKPVSDYRKAQRRLAQQRMLMRHMHMGISMDIAVQVSFICVSPFLRWCI